MKKLLFKKENIIYYCLFFLLVVVHFPLLTKNILTADVILNNSFYNGYRWELSVGRFGLFIVGILKSYLSIPHIELFISFLLITLITYFLIRIFDIKNTCGKILSITLMILSPIISSTLLFHYCSVPYLLAFLGSVLSVYFYFFSKNKTIKYLLPLFLIVLSLSMYQAYLSVMITTFFLYQIKLLFDKKIDYKESGIYLLLLLAGVIVYFVCMKLSLLVFHIDMASYSNANKIGFDTILQAPKNLVEAYCLFYQMFFTNTFTKNTYLFNNILYLIIFIIFVINFVIKLFKEDIDIKNKILIVLLLLLIPVFLNSIIFVIGSSKLQLLMSASYLVLFFFIFNFSYEKRINYILIFLMVCLFRNYLIQDQATYITLEENHKAYNTVIGSVINNNINSNNKYIIVGNIDNHDSYITNRNYGYISDEVLFWDEYNLRSLGFERFCYQEFGINVEFGNEESYLWAKNNMNKTKVFEKDGNIIINLNNY